MKRAALVLCLAGCTAQVTALNVSVTAPSSITLDQLRLYAALEYGPLAQVEPDTAMQLTLPYTFTAYLPDLTETAQVAVDGTDEGLVRATALSPPISIVEHQSPIPTIDLALVLRCDPHGSTCRGDELFCDGFEDALTAWSGSTGAPTVEGTIICDGLNALGLSSSQPQYVTKSGLSLTSTVYVRSHVYIPSSATLPASQLFALTDGTNTLALTYDQPNGQFTTTYAGTTTAFKGAVSLDRWACVQMKATLDPANGFLLVAVDDAELDRVDHVATAPATGFTTLEAGLVSPGGAAQLYLDDVAVASSPLPCD